MEAGAVSRRAPSPIYSEMTTPPSGVQIVIQNLWFPTPTGTFASPTYPTTDQCVYYSPHSQAMKIYPKEPHDGDETCLEFHMLSPDGAEERPSRVVCVHHERSWAWARVAVFSSHTMEWHILPAGPALRFRGPWSEPDQTRRYGLFRLIFFYL